MNIGDFFDLLTWQDLLDVAIVAIVFYNLLLLIRGTRTVQILVGLAFVAATSYLARWANLVALETLIQKFPLVLPFALVVLFQPEIRRALARFGRGPFFGIKPAKTDAHLQEVALAATTLAERRTGALIVFERKEGLRTYVENGIALDARISFDLLVSIFTPDAPLHDGAGVRGPGRDCAVRRQSRPGSRSGRRCRGRAGWCLRRGRAGQRTLHRRA